VNGAFFVPFLGLPFPCCLRPFSIVLPSTFPVVTPPLSGARSFFWFSFLVFLLPCAQSLREPFLPCFTTPLICSWMPICFFCPSFYNIPGFVLPPPASAFWHTHPSFVPREAWAFFFFFIWRVPLSGFFPSRPSPIILPLYIFLGAPILFTMLTQNLTLVSLDCLSFDAWNVSDTLPNRPEVFLWAFSFRPKNESPLFLRVCSMATVGLFPTLFFACFLVPQYSPPPPTSPFLPTPSPAHPPGGCFRNLLDFSFYFPDYRHGEFLSSLLSGTM